MVQPGDRERLREMYHHEIEQLNQLRRATEVGYQAAIEELERRCEEEHGGHEDDGSLFYGFCKRCGACLG